MEQDFAADREHAKRRLAFNRLTQIAQELARRNARRRFFLMFPDETRAAAPCCKPPAADDLRYFARHLYPRHMEFFAAGATYRERAAIAANRVGKTWGMGAFEVTCHLTGLYPPWWEGRRFKRPIRAWAAGKSNETTRDIVQEALLGEVEGSGPNKCLSGTGMVPGHLIGRPTWKQGVANLVDTVKIRHASGGTSILGLKSYEQGRGSFEGTAQHLIWFDEEPPIDVYGEALIRTATTNGLIFMTFTPLEGMSEVVLSYLGGMNEPDEAPQFDVV